jgi:hypothetical protein
MELPKRTYSIVSEDTWALIRSAYLSGLSGALVARRFNVSLSALRKRAQREGWTKADQARALGQAPAAVQPAPPPSRDPRVLVRTAMDEAARALADGRPYAARACAAAGHQIARLADLLPDYTEADSVHEINARHAYWMSAVEELALDLAQRLSRGERLPPEYATLDARWRAGQAGA